MNRKFISVTDEEAIKLLDSGKSLEYITKTFGGSPECLSKRLKKKGYIIINKQNERGTKHSLFKNIDSEEKAYWLGFLFADGNVHSTTNQITICLKIADYSHLEKFKKFIGANNRIYINDKTKSCRYQFFSKEMKLDLINLGCIPKKSLTLEFPTKIPKHLITYFIRGYFDGDGCLTYYKKSKSKICDLVIPCIKILGTSDLLNGIKDNFSFNSGTIRKANIKGSDFCKEVGYYGINAINFLNNIYYNSNIHLERKYLRYKLFEVNNFAVQKRNLLDY